MTIDNDNKANILGETIRAATYHKMPQSCCARCLSTTGPTKEWTLPDLHTKKEVMCYLCPKCDKELTTFMTTWLQSIKQKKAA